MNSIHSLLKKILFFIGMFATLFSLSVWATTTSTALKTVNPLLGETFLWRTGFVNSLSVKSPQVVFLAPACPAGLTPYFNVAAREGYMSPESSSDPGIRGIHLKVEGCTIDNTLYTPNVYGLCKAITEPVRQQIYIIVDEAYLDTIASGDKAIDVSYWVYCGP